MAEQYPLVSLNDLQVPDTDKFQEVLSKVGDDYRQQFIGELLEALDTKNVNRVQHVLHAWWASTLFTTHPGFDGAVAGAETNDEDPLTIEQVGVLLGVA